MGGGGGCCVYVGSGLAVLAIPPLECNTLVVIFEETAEMGGCSVYLRSNLSHYPSS